jgi:hypothetical protein
MAGTFDPYHKWLGIAADEQPANYYRLLGIRAFEADPDVIAGAADQRTMHVRSFQSGRHPEVSQQILNEITAARVCLLNPERKAAYDDRLRVEQQGGWSRPRETLLNMDGGLIVLGVEDDGTVSGVDPEVVERIKSDIANLLNNPQKLDPPYLLAKYYRLTCLS